MDALSMISAAMHNDADSLRVVAENIANAENVAYRRQVSVAQVNFPALLDDALSSQEMNAPRVETLTDMRSGTLKSTGEPLHIAIEGGGYFVVDTAQGEMLSRRGDFRTDASGMLTTYKGDLVQGTNGPIHIGNARPSINADGTLHIGGEVIDRLRLVEVVAGTNLTSMGEGNYSVADTSKILDSDSRVRQGFVETSNVSPVNEMMQMMETMRHFETAQRFARGYDDMLEKAISQLGKI